MIQAPSMFNNSNINISGGMFTMENNMVSIQYSTVLVIHVDRLDRKRTSIVCVLPIKLTTELFSEHRP